MTTYKTLDERMTAIRKAMDKASRTKDQAEFRRLNDEHRMLWEISCILPETAIDPNCAV